MNPTPVGINRQGSAPALSFIMNPTPVGINLVPWAEAGIRAAATMNPTPVGINRGSLLRHLLTRNEPHTRGDKPLCLELLPIMI